MTKALRASHAARAVAALAFSALGLQADVQAQGLPPPSSGIATAPGLYVQVLDGMIHVTNAGGTQNFTAGQFGFTPSFKQPPVVLPSNPGIQFSPPPAFNTTAGNQAANSTKPGTVDCVVR